MIRKKNLIRILAIFLSVISLQIFFLSKSVARELNPDTVIQSMYVGVAHIHGGKAVPKIYRPIMPGVRTGCGPMPRGNAFYCPRDHSIYIGIDMVQRAYREGGDAALAYIIGHEYAHAMQTVYNFNTRGGIVTELQADCLAGFYMNAVPNITFDDEDIREIAILAYGLGDSLPVWNKSHHGSPKQRVGAVVVGLRAKNWKACRI
jgi:uncharacterized protein